MTLCTKKKRTARPNHLSRPPRWRLALPESVVSFQGARLPRQAPPGTLPPRPRPRPRVPRPLPRPRFIFGPLSTSPPLPLASPSPPPSFSLLRSNVFSSLPSAMVEGRYGRPCLSQLGPLTFPYGNIQFVRGGLFSGDKEIAREPSIIIRLCEKSKRERSTRQRCTA